jgi:alpha-1,6-mannosyltransferase
MKIVDVCAFYSPTGGGVKTYVHRKLAAAAQHGHDMTIIAPAKHNGEEHLSARTRIIHIKSPVLAVDKNYHYFTRNPARLYALLDAFAPDVVEASSPWRAALHVARWHGTALRSLIMHADPLSAYAYRWLGGLMPRPRIDALALPFWRHLRQLDAQFDTVICASEDFTQRLLVGGLTKPHTNAMGVEAHLFSPQLRNPQVRAELLQRCGLSPSAALLIGIGRFAPEKRWPLVMQAVAAAHTHAPVGLVLLGAGRAAAQVQAAAAAHSHITLHPPVTNRHAVAELLASADALIHGCEAETFGLVGAEARASGLPLIVPDAGGMKEQGMGAASEMYNAADAASASAAILRLMANLPERRAIAVAEAANVRTMDAHFAALFAGYEKLLARR